jgi:hypothetical protein
MFRIVERLRIQEETKLFSELPIPQFKNPQHLASLKRAIVDVQKCPVLLTAYSEFSKKEPDDLRLLMEYQTKLYDIRDARMLKILKESLQKDLAARETNPAAPLKHLVTIESYDRAISIKRLKLAGELYKKALSSAGLTLTKKIALVFFAFFFAPACFIALRSRWQA